MKRMLIKMRVVGLLGSRLTLVWCLLLAGLAVAVPTVAPAQESDMAKATEELFDAVHAKDFAAVQASVAAGADVEASDRWGMTPMELAIDKGYFEIGHYLVAVRNFNRANEEQRPSVTGPAGSPFGSASSRDVGSRPSGHGSPLGPLSKPASADGAISSDPTDVDIETSAGPATGDQQQSTGEASPFDPNAPAHGAGAFTVGEIGGAASGVPSGIDTGPDPLLGVEDNSATLSPGERTAQTSVPSEDGEGGSAFSNRVIGVGGSGSDSRAPTLLEIPKQPSNPRRQ